MNTHTNDGGPAFPTQNGTRNDQGMTLRDWFAGMALQGLLHQRQEVGDWEPSGSIKEDSEGPGLVYKGKSICVYVSDADMLASDAYKIADEMLVTRDRKGEG
jgi:hypothetical protein